MTEDENVAAVVAYLTKQAAWYRKEAAKSAALYAAGLEEAWSGGISRVRAPLYEAAIEMIQGHYIPAPPPRPWWQRTLNWWAGI